MLVMLTDARHDTPVLVNLDQLLYAYRDASEEATVLIFGKVAPPGQAAPNARLRPVALVVSETLREIQEKRRLVTG